MNVKADPVDTPALIAPRARVSAEDALWPWPVNWDEAEPVALELPGAPLPDAKPIEPGRARVVWDDQYVYVRFDLSDSQLVNTSSADNDALWEKGSVVEVFLKPRTRLWYWEFHLSPRGTTSQIHLSAPPDHPERTSHYVDERFIKAHVLLGGPLNVTDGPRADGWTAFMAIPWNKLAGSEEPPVSRDDWTIFFGRYNASSLLPDGEELTAWPAPSAVNFHLVDEYADLRLR